MVYFGDVDDLLRVVLKATRLCFLEPVVPEPFQDVVEVGIDPTPVVEGISWFFETGNIVVE